MAWQQASAAGNLPRLGGSRVRVQRDNVGAGAALAHGPSLFSPGLPSLSMVMKRYSISAMRP